MEEKTRELAWHGERCRTNCVRQPVQYGVLFVAEQIRRAGELGIAQEEARVAQGEIITASGVSDSIALTEGGGVWTGGGEGET